MCNSGKFNFQNKEIYKSWLSACDQYWTDRNRPCNSFVPTLALMSQWSIWWVTQPEIDDEHVQLILFHNYLWFLSLKGSHHYQMEASLLLLIIKEVHVGTTNYLLCLLLFLIIIFIGFIWLFTIKISFLDSLSKG